MSDALRLGRAEPIAPAYVHPIPIVTIQKLATALYWIGRTAIRGQTDTCDKAKARLALIEQAAREVLEEAPA